MSEKKELMNNEEFIRKATQTDSEEELLQIFNEYGIELDSNRLHTLLSSHRQEEMQLTAEQLEHIAGGSFFSDFWQGFKYGFTSPFEAIGTLIAQI